MKKTMNGDPGLTNHDLAPAGSKSWGTYSLTAVWFAAVHNIGVYTAAAGLLLVGLPAWAVLVGLCLGYLLTYVGAQMIGEPGRRYGIPFPVLARASFGVLGANVPALIRALIAVAWYGIQTYLASRAVMILLLSIEPGLTPLTRGGILGLSPLGWACFLGLWALQLVVVSHGMELIRRFQNWAGAVVSVMMVSLAVVLAVQAGGHLDWGFAGGSDRDGPGYLTGVLQVALATFTIYSTLLLNFCDFTRFSTSARAVRRANLLGLPLNGAVFSLTVVVVTLSGQALYGRTITEPTDLLQRSGRPALLAIGAVLFVFATIGVNVVANLVSPAYDLSNVFPRKIGFRGGAIVTCLLSLVVTPWNLYSSDVAVTYFLGTMGALLGPVFAIMMVDYYLERRRHIDLDDLYSEAPTGRYHYSGGFHRAALACLVLASCVSVPVAVVPAFHAFSWSSWVLGAAVAGGMYHGLARHRLAAGTRIANTDEVAA